MGVVLAVAVVAGQAAGSEPVPAPTVSIGATAVVEGNSGTRSVVVPITLSRPLDHKLRVTFATIAGRPAPAATTRARPAR